ncbi:GNAT family N-acetyltransferase [Paramicrobacterium chengjingii]|uniref:GNAT family N-acetyltransferase n=1 Tax=Paramicrobacterium chengjingii TaxID=2769067 RepID=UPI00142472B2|nr:GNAT family N-acetyltransferase [Microbacterium chengjingii]
MYRVRRRTSSDCANVVRWVPDAEALYLFTGPRLKWPLTATQLADMEQICGFSAWVMVEAETATLVGHFDLMLNGHEARVGRILIAPEMRGRGLARVLLRSVTERARELGASRLVLNVIVGNEPAIRAYESAGFVTVTGIDRSDVRAMALTLHR